MISIDTSLKRATTVATQWSTEAARTVADDLASNPSTKIDWDQGAGEQWIRVLDDRKPTALVSIILPLVIIEGSASSFTSTPQSVVSIHVDDLDGIELSASLKALVDAFGSRDRFHALNPDGFSANDLWYATV